MKGLLRLSVLALAALMVVSLAAASEARAAEPPPGTDLVLSPAIIEPAVNPGAVSETTVYLSNRSARPTGVKAVVRTQAGDAANPVPAGPAYDASGWTSVTPNTFTLQPGEQRPITVSVAAPASVEPGGHYSTVQFEPLTADAPSAGATTRVSGGIGVRVMVIVAGDIREQLSVVGPVGLPRLSIGGDVEAVVKLNNDGNVHLLPDGYLSVSDRHGRPVGQVQLPPRLILPQTQRTARVKIKGLPVGRNKVVGVVTYGRSGRLQVAPESVLVVPSYVRPIAWATIALIAVLACRLIIKRLVNRRRETPLRS